MGPMSRFWRRYRRGARFRSRHSVRGRRWLAVVVGLLVVAGVAAGGRRAGWWQQVREAIARKTGPEEAQRPPAHPALPPAPVRETPPPPSPDVHEAVAARDAADYERALKLAEEGAGRRPQDQEWLDLHRELMTDLKVDFRFHYLPQRRLPARTAGSDQVRLGPDDGYYLTVHPSDRCHLYLLRQTSAGELIRLCPNDRYVPTPNPVLAELQRVPDGFGWLRVDPGPGVEKIYLVAARWRLSALEGLLNEWEAARDPGARRSLVDKVVARLEVEGRLAERVPGLAYAFYQFHHEE